MAARGVFTKIASNQQLSLLFEGVWVPTAVIAALARWVGLLPAVLGPGVPGTHVAETLCFPGFNTGPPPPLEVFAVL